MIIGLRSLRSRDPLDVTTQRKSPSSACGVCSVLSHQGFFFVAEAGEISNLKLVGDIFKILEFLESNVSGIQDIVEKPLAS
jgi:hypothetical protein